MDLKFLTHDDKIGIIFEENGISSEIIMLTLEDAEALKEQTILALRKENDKADVFTNKFAYIKQKNNMFLLSIKVNDFFATGKIMKFQDLKRIVSQLKRLIRGIK